MIRCSAIGLAAAVLFAALTGCKPTDSHGPVQAATNDLPRNAADPASANRDARGTPPDLNSIYARANLWFTNAVVCKPALEGQDLLSVFAPIFVLKAGLDAKAIQVPEKVYGSTDAIELGGQTRARLSFTWNSGAGSQGIRITLGSAGEPVLWELPPNAAGVQVVFAAKSLEEKAAEKFGEPPPGRRFALEPTLEAAPFFVVARVLEDGPVPMGPIVYVDETSDVATVICRCMPAQASNVTGSQTYELVRGAIAPEMARFDEHAVSTLRLPENW